MTSAAAVRSTGELRVLVMGHGGAPSVHAASALPELLEPGDLVVVNDAATLPASLPARDAQGAAIEIRLAGAPSSRTVDGGKGRVCFAAALLGAGDWRTRTEDRPTPPRVAIGDTLFVNGHELTARVLAVGSFSERFVELALETEHGDVAAVWAALYRLGRPVQYAHVLEPLHLWDVQNVFADRPWAVEMPSAGRVIRGSSIAALRARGIEVVTITHAAGLSATGDPRIDARLPLPERFEVPHATVRAIVATKQRGGRVIAVGTSVVRALESAARDHELRAASGVTDLLIGVATKLRVVDALVTGVHEVATSHFTLLGAFARAPALEAALEVTARAGLLGHELGDAWLVWRDPAIARARSATFAA